MTYVASTYWRSGAQSKDFAGAAARPTSESDPPRIARLPGHGGA